MAKANMSKLIEQHVEKAVVGLCALLLLFGIVHWGTSSAREVEIQTSALTSPEARSTNPAGSPMLRPNQLDAEVAKEVANLASSIGKEAPKQPPLPDYLDSVKKAMEPIPDTRIVSLSLPRPPLASATAEPQVRGTTMDDLAAIAVAPSVPQVNAKQVLPHRDPLADATVACGSGTWAYTDQLNAWTEKLKGTNIAASVIVAGQELERQERNPDGSWGKSEIVKLDPLAMKDANGKELTVPQIPPSDGTNYTAIQQALNDLNSPESRQQILQPKYADVYWAAKRAWVDWRVNLPPTELNVAEGPAVDAVGTPSGAVAETAAPTPAPVAAPAPTGRRSRAPATPTTAARPPATPAGEGKSLVLYPNPPLAKQFQMGKVNVWFCDQTLQAGKVYRYRQRLKLANPLLAMANNVKDKADAAAPYIFTPWSDWSSDVASPRSAEFFVTGGSDARGNIQVAIFSFCMGQVVEQSLQVTPGQAIGGKVEKVEVANPVAPGKLINAVDFSTGCVTVDVNFAKPVYGRSGLSKTIELLYVDGSGQLRSKLQQLDTNSETYIGLQKESRR